jgi:hypothetical protein
MKIVIKLRKIPVLEKLKVGDSLKWRLENGVLGRDKGSIHKVKRVGPPEPNSPFGMYKEGSFTTEDGGRFSKEDLHYWELLEE